MASRVLKNTIIAFFLCIAIFDARAEDVNRDSLLNYLKLAADDTNKVKCLGDLFFEYEFEDVEKARAFALQAIDISKKITFEKGVASGYTYLGYLADDNGNYDDAIENYKKSLAIYKKIKNQKGQCTAYRNISAIYISKSQYPKALEYSFLSLKIAEEINDFSAISSNYGTIGAIYHGMEDYEKALLFFIKSVENYKKSGRTQGL